MLACPSLGDNQALQPILYSMCKARKVTMFLWIMKSIQSLPVSSLCCYRMHFRHHSVLLERAAKPRSHLCTISSISTKTKLFPGLQTTFLDWLHWCNSLIHSPMGLSSRIRRRYGCRYEGAEFTIAPADTLNRLFPTSLCSAPPRARMHALCAWMAV